MSRQAQGELPEDSDAGQTLGHGWHVERAEGSCPGVPYDSGTDSQLIYCPATMCRWQRPWAMPPTETAGILRQACRWGRHPRVPGRTGPTFRKRTSTWRRVLAPAGGECYPDDGAVGRKPCGCGEIWYSQDLSGLLRPQNPVPAGPAPPRSLGPGPVVNSAGSGKFGHQ